MKIAFKGFLYESSQEDSIGVDGNIIGESITPKKPSRVLTKTGTNNAGTNLASKKYFKEFTTSKGNLVKVFFKKGATLDSLTVDFAVNDSYDVKDRSVDNEVLQGVLYVVKKYVDKVKPNIISLAINNEDDRGDSRHAIFTNLLIKHFPEYKIYPQSGKYSIILEKINN